MRRVVQDGQTPRHLHEQATTKSCRQSAQRARAQPWARIPHSRVRRNARSVTQQFSFQVRWQEVVRFRTVGWGKSAGVWGVGSEALVHAADEVVPVIEGQVLQQGAVGGARGLVTDGSAAGLHGSLLAAVPQNMMKAWSTMLRSSARTMNTSRLCRSSSGQSGSGAAG